MADPFATLADPFDALDSFPRSRRPAMYPALDDPNTETAIQALTRGTLGTLGYVGSTLDKLSGARAVRGLAGGKMRELLSVIPGSDVLGLTDETQTVRGEDLLRNLGYDPSKGNWIERNLVGPGLEIALDPATYAGGIGALTKLGKGVAKAAPVARGLQAVRAGQRSLHPLLAGAEFVKPGTQAAAADLLEATGRKVGVANRAARQIPKVAQVEDWLADKARWAEIQRKSLFHPPAGIIPHPAFQAAEEAINYPTKEATARTVRELKTKLYPEYEGIIKEHGFTQDEADRYVRQFGELGYGDLYAPHLHGHAGAGAAAAPGGSALEGASPALEGTGQLGLPGPKANLPGRLLPLETVPAGVLKLQAFTNKLKDLQRGARQKLEVEAGSKSPELDDFIDYFLRRRSPATAGLGDILSEVFSSSRRALPPTNPSYIKRKEAYRNWEGGTTAIEDLLSGQERVRGQIAGAAYAGPKRVLTNRQINQALLADQLNKYHIGRQLQKTTDEGETILRGGMQGPLSPTGLRQMREKAVAMQRALKNVPLENIEGGVAGKARVPFFVTDPIYSALLRVERAGRTAGNIDTQFDIIKRLARRMPNELADDVKVPDILSRGKLDTEIGVQRGLEAVGYPELEDTLQRQMALRPEAPRLQVMKDLLAEYSLPKPEADLLTKAVTRWAPPVETAPLVKLWDWLGNKFKTGSYTVWPGSLVRNITGGRAENAVMAGMSPLSPMYGVASRSLAGQPVNTGIQALAHLSPAEQSLALKQEAYIHGVLSGVRGEMAERVGRSPIPTPGGNPLAPQPGVGGILRELKGPLGWAEMMRSQGVLAEDRMRLAEFAHLRAAGHTAEQAADTVEKTHFDYSKLTPFENIFAKRLIPFYTFPRRNLPKQLGRAIERPATVSGPVRFSGALEDQQGEGYVPEYLRSGLAFPLGMAVPGVERYLSSLGLPVEEAFSRLKIGQDLPETIARTGEAYMANLRPELRVLLEGMTGRQFFTGRNLADLRPGNVELALSGGNERVARLLSEGASATPFSRALATANRLADERKYHGGLPGWLVAEGIPLASGARIADVDVEKWRAVDARNQLEQQLQAMRHVKESKDYYIPRDIREKGQVTPEDVMALRTYASLKERAKKAQEAKRRVGVQVSGG